MKKFLLFLVVVCCQLANGFSLPCATAQTTAESPARSASGETTYDFARLRSFDDERWFFLALGSAFLAMALYVWVMYRRDGVELRPGVRYFLLLLRVAAFVLIFIFFLQPQRRNQRTVVHNSRVLILVDTSSSMARQDKDQADGATLTRMEPVVAALQDGTLLGGLREQHDLVVARFDREVKRIVSLSRIEKKIEQKEGDPATGGRETGGTDHLDAAADAAPRQGEKTDEPGSDTPGAADSDSPGDVASAAPTDADSNVDRGLAGVDWKKELFPRGAQTRIGDALRSLLRDQSGGPVAGVVVISDGAQNAGVDVDAAIELARESRIPIYTVGLGSDQKPRNVRLSDFTVPERAYPGDSFKIAGIIQAAGLTDRRVTVELFSRDASEKNSVGMLEDTKAMILPADGELREVSFEVSQEEPGRYTYEIRLSGVADDDNAEDNRKQAEVDIVARKTRVLLLASGATREYRFLRNQLYRDKDVVLDVLLQSARGPVSQDADELLDEFPDNKQDLFEYDCIVAFDPDWTQLDLEQIDLLERWVAEEAGGLIVIAGPIHTGNWTRRTDMAKILDLYPVQFERRLSLLEDDRYGSTTPRPIVFTPEGEEAQFLQIEDSPLASEAAWESFPGVFGYYAVKGPKPGATVYGNLGDPAQGLDSRGPVYLAGHYYGAGRVFYSGSGEMWRLRSLDEACFEKYYTKLIRHVSQGRLLRGSNNGVLLIERNRYQLGGTVVVRAQLSDEQHEPYAADSVAAAVTEPDGSTIPLMLKADPTRAGFFQGDFSANQPGPYQIDLATSESIDQPLSKRIEVTVPRLEGTHPQRNDSLLAGLATGTDGLYYLGLESALQGSESLPALASRLVSQAETTTLVGAPDKEFDKLLMQITLGAVCGLLCLEWLIRRLSKLA